MNAYSYDQIRFEAQQHFNRLADEAAADRLARELRDRTAPQRPRGLRRLRPAWAARMQGYRGLLSA